MTPQRPMMRVGFSPKRYYRWDDGGPAHLNCDRATSSDAPVATRTSPHDSSGGALRRCSVTVTAPVISPIEVTEQDHAVDLDRPWKVIVWDDPVNLMSYVTFVFRKLFGYSKEKAAELMMEVHTTGRAVVSTGTREKSELDVFRLHEHGLWATMEHDS